jgi:hypothetical protein
VKLVGLATILICSKLNSVGIKLFSHILVRVPLESDEDSDTRPKDPSIFSGTDVIGLLSST